MKQTIKLLGTADEKLTGALEQLRADPQQAVRILVAELHSIPHRVYYETTKTKDSRHVIACLRALHYLTGKTFEAKSSQRLNDDERQFLDFKEHVHDSNPDHQLHFFGVWMSRNADFVAPIDAQEKIIKQWQQWQAEHGDSFDYSPLNKLDRSPDKTMEQWFWFG